MNILFQAKYDNHTNYINEIYKHMYFKSASMTAVYVCFAIVVITNLLNLVLTENPDYVMLLGILIFVYLFAVVFFRYRRSVKMYESRQKEINGDKAIEITAAAAEESVYIAESGGREVNVSYSDIKKAFETKNTVVLHSKSNLLYIFPKDAFTVGNASDFMKFLKSKGIKGVG